MTGSRLDDAILAMSRTPKPRFGQRETTFSTQRLGIFAPALLGYSIPVVYLR